MKGISILITDLILTLIVLSVFSMVFASTLRNINEIRGYSSRINNVTLGSCFIIILARGGKNCELIVASTVNKTQLVTLTLLKNHGGSERLARFKLGPYAVRVMRISSSYKASDIVAVSSLGCSETPEEVVG